MPLKYINWASYFTVYPVLPLYSLSYLAGPLRRKGCDNRDPYIRLDPYHCCLHNRKVSCNYHPNGILNYMNALWRYGHWAINFSILKLDNQIAKIFGTSFMPIPSKVMY